ncbi:MAG TPA: tripartite tricarboxylate transporter substrate-binding protein [Burkholderiales bacterium]|nr:tripartite tricarboxylate transporter substrate-binding protein [Burkholderiales bacterium]
MKKCLLAVLALVASSALAQQYPNRPVKVIIPWPPGQATDLAARIVGEKLAQQLGQPFIMENKPGAGGAIGTEIVAKSAPDGYTLLAASSGPISIMPNLQKIPYDPLKDLAPVSLIAAAPFTLVVAANFPASNAKEFLALVRANPGKYTFASSGTGATAHMFAELFNSMAQLKVVHIPYKGSVPALTDVISGQVAYAVETVAAAGSFIKSGKLKSFGVTTARRSAALADAPPLAEAADIPGYDCAAWIGYAAAAGTPREILVKLAAEIQKAVQDTTLKERYVVLGMDTASNTPDEMLAYWHREQDRYASIVKSANIKIEQ